MARIADLGYGKVVSGVKDRNVQKSRSRMHNISCVENVPFLNFIRSSFRTGYGTVYGRLVSFMITIQKGKQNVLLERFRFLEKKRTAAK